MRQEVSEADLLAAAKQSGIDLPPYQAEIISSDDWLTENVIKFAPVETGDFLVYGVHEKNVDTHGKIGVKVYAATAFGSEHQTTKGCLQAISDISRLAAAKPQKVLDVGTGSGILAIAAAKIWPATHIVAVDIDSESVLVATQNAVDNGVEKQINVALSDGYQAELVQKNAPYDVILANILARPLIAMASDMATSLKKGGFAVISGFIEDQVEWVLDAHEKYGLHLKKMYREDGWCAALLEKTK
jgi:ribosomal protein L11 methyltransferase